MNTFQYLIFLILSSGRKINLFMVGEFQVRVDFIFDNVSSDIKKLVKANVFYMLCLNSLDNRCFTSYMRKVT